MESAAVIIILKCQEWSKLGDTFLNPLLFFWKCIIFLQHLLSTRNANYWLKRSHIIVAACISVNTGVINVTSSWGIHRFFTLNMSQSVSNSYCMSLCTTSHQQTMFTSHDCCRCHSEYNSDCIVHKSVLWHRCFHSYIKKWIRFFLFN